jgi:hypothetical protein
MRAWLAILSEKHPEYTWIAVEEKLSVIQSPIAAGDFACNSDEGARDSEPAVRAA